MKTPEPHDEAFVKQFRESWDSYYPEVDEVIRDHHTEPVARGTCE